MSWNPAPTATAPGAASSVVFTHSYNKVNQRTGQSVTDNAWIDYPAATPGTVSYTANTLNQYTAVGAATPTYDANGNLTSDGTHTYGYDAENRLVSASGAGTGAAYTFDAQGRRKTVTTGGTTTVFVTDADDREVLEYDGASGAIQRWYAHGLGPNDVLGQMNVPADTRTTFVPDLLGSVVATMDAGTGTLSRFGYRPYRRTLSDPLQEFLAAIGSIPAAGVGAGGARALGSTARTTSQAIRAANSAKVDAVIAETLVGKGNITSPTKLSADELLQAGIQFLGPGYKEIGKPGSGVFRSVDNTRQFRIDRGSLTGSHAPGVPHGHLEIYAPGAKMPTVNNHIPFFD